MMRKSVTIIARSSVIVLLKRRSLSTPPKSERTPRRSFWLGWLDSEKRMETLRTMGFNTRPTWTKKESPRKLKEISSVQVSKTGKLTCGETSSSMMLASGSRRSTTRGKSSHHPQLEKCVDCSSTMSGLFQRELLRRKTRKPRLRGIAQSTKKERVSATLAETTHTNGVLTKKVLAVTMRSGTPCLQTTTQNLQALIQQLKLRISARQREGGLRNRTT